MLKYVFAVLVVALSWAVVIVLGLPLWVGIVATIAAVLTLVGIILLRQWQARRAARALEAEIEAQGQEHARSVRPELQAEIQAMQQEFTRAVASLKSSRLGRTGAAALYALPWYVVIGPPGAGKTTALRNSGLQFPYLSAKGGGVRGVGGTRNCEWWFTNDAVILDTAGRYATRDDDRDEWLSFLQMVKQHRPRRPINGIIVGVPVGDVAGAGEEEIVALARRLRERIDEVMGRLQMVVPVYMMFTKCDLVPGFVEIFGNLRKTERGQIMGFTLPLGKAASPPGDLFAGNFDELHRTTEQWALRRMGEERKIETRELIYGFPQQLGVLRDDLALFVGTLFQDNVYQDAPILRGAYFSSGTQEGSPIDRMMAGMARAFGLPPRTMLAEPTVEAKSYFLRDIFDKVVFPDADLAVRSAEAVRQERSRRIAIAAGAFGLAALLSILPAYAFVRNLGLVKSTRGLVDTLRKSRVAGQAIAPEKLAPLRQRVDELHAFEENGPPLAMRFGMYAGGDLYPPLRDYYTNVLRQQLLEPIVAADSQALSRFAQQYADPSVRPTSETHRQFFDKLKMHLLLTTPKAANEPAIVERERRWLTDQVVRRWGDQLEVEPKKEEREAMATNARLYFDLLAQDPKLAFPRDVAMVGKARVPLSSVPVESLEIERLVGEVENEGLDLTLAHILGGAAGPLRSNERIRGAFTRKGWEGKVRQLLSEERADDAEVWVLGQSATTDRATRDQRRKKLRSRYFYQYIQEWQGFIDSLRIEEPTDGDAALATLQDLTRGVPPPYGRLFEAIGSNTQIEDSDADKRKAGLVKMAEDTVLTKVRKKMGVGMTKAADQALPPAKRVRADQELSPEHVRLAFADFVAFGVPPAPPAGQAKDAPPPPAAQVPLTVYQEQLAFVRDALVTYRESPEDHTAPLLTRLQEARTRARALIEAGKVGWRPRLQTLLWPPIEGATATSSTTVAKGKGQKWCTDVVTPFHRTLASRYPFNPTGHDAALADVAEFFRPGAGTLWSFYEKALRSDISRTGDKFKFSTKLGREPKFQDRLIPYLEKSLEVSTVLFPANGKDILSTLEVRIRPTPEIAQITLTIDGQVVEYHNGPEQWVMVNWPAAGKVRGASLRVRGRSGVDETIQQDGEWGLFRLLEQGTISGDPTSRTFNVVWHLRTHKMNITVSVRPARSETPFFGQSRQGAPLRLLAPFRSPEVSPPNTITANSPACPTPR
jgi:type VI secretion system protein ImpL